LISGFHDTADRFSDIDGPRFLRFDAEIIITRRFASLRRLISSSRLQFSPCPPRRCARSSQRR